MIVRQATDSDSAPIVEFQLAMAWETEQLKLHEPTVIKGVAAVFEDSSKGIYYVAEVEGKIVGSLLTTFEWSDWRNGTVLWIQSVYVAEKWRRKNVFRKLYEHIQSMVNQDPNLKGIRLYVDKGNQAAQQVYGGLGMNGEHYGVFEWMKS